MIKKKGSGSGRSAKRGAGRKPKDALEFHEEKRSRYLAGVEIDFKNGELLKRFMTEHGKIMPRRITGTSAKQQRQLKNAIRQARIVGLVR